jgi:hypothetical protein
MSFDFEDNSKKNQCLSCTLCWYKYRKYLLLCVCINRYIYVGKSIQSVGINESDKYTRYDVS